MATRAQTPRAPRKKAAPARASQRASADLSSEGKPLLPTTNKSVTERSQRPPTISGEVETAKQQPAFITPAQLGKLISVLMSDGFEVIGPVVRDGAITYESVKSVTDLPAGWTDESGPGRYRLKKTDSPALFGYSLGAQSWKRYLHPSEVQLFAADKQNGAFHILNNDLAAARPRVFLGVRACELVAIKAQDRVLLGDKYRDPIYAANRDDAFIVAVQCSKSAATCFCASLGSGPKVGSGYDLLLIEFVDANSHRFLVEAGSSRGADIVAQVEAKSAPATDVAAARTAIPAAAEQQRKLDTEALKEFLYQNFENPYWDKISARCLSCANCTMSCPTCFCTTVDDATDVTGTHAERWRRWDSCFTQSFSYIHGGSVRTSVKARYRQWMTHKLAAWSDQFGSLGCVGCGRCITWCPAAIDITEEVRAMREGGVRADA